MEERGFPEQSVRASANILMFPESRRTSAELQQTHFGFKFLVNEHGFIPFTPPVPLPNGRTLYHLNDL